MKAIWNNQVIAESNDTIVIEGNHYFPPDSVNRDFLQASTHTSECPWKGHATYSHVVVDGETNENAAWHYMEPFDAAKEITGYIAFWNGVDITA